MNTVYLYGSHTHNPHSHICTHTHSQGRRDVCMRERERKKEEGGRKGGYWKASNGRERKRESD